MSRCLHCGKLELCAPCANGNPPYDRREYEKPGGTSRLPRCALTDLPRLLCGCPEHNNGFTMTAGEQAYLNGDHGPPTTAPVHHNIPIRVEYPRRRHDNTLPLAPDWNVAIPAPIICDHKHTDDTFICHDCTTTFEQMLGDIPALMEDLDLTRTKQVTFLDQGAPKEADPDEAALEFNHRASKAVVALTTAFGGNPTATSRAWLADFKAVTRRPDLQTLAGRVSSAVENAHYAIEHPTETFDYGPCGDPKCGLRIVRERITRGSADRTITCECGYAATLDEHQRIQIERGENDWRTTKELLEALKIIEEPLQRSRLDNMVKHHGLPREQRKVPVWTNGVSVWTEEWVYRLSDVRAVVRGERLDTAPLTTEQVAAVLSISPGGVRKMVERGQLVPIEKAARPLRFVPEHVAEVMRQQQEREKIELDGSRDAANVRECG